MDLPSTFACADYELLSIADQQRLLICVDMDFFAERRTPMAIDQARLLPDALELICRDDAGAFLVVLESLPALESQRLRNYQAVLAGAGEHGIELSLNIPPPRAPSLGMRR